ncbi:MAG: hypothetical protein EKK55_16435 [Rhodocyclaceae bacterium]|nr:MAG: hypothetical protein EKK55_16435 [Rhodocyclaceae bacterium]
MSEPERRDDGPAWSGPAVGCALVWEFDKAPPELRALSQHYGDEDWLVYVPAGLTGFEPEWPAGWIRGLGCHAVHYHHLADGALVYIGAHA